MHTHFFPIAPFLLVLILISPRSVFRRFTIYLFLYLLLELIVFFVAYITSVFSDFAEFSLTAIQSFTSLRYPFIDTHHSIYSSTTVPHFLRTRSHPHRDGAGNFYAYQLLCPFLTIGAHSAHRHIMYLSTPIIILQLYI